MVPAGLLVLAASATASLSVRATVVRPAQAPALAIERGTVVIRNAASVAVSAEGGIVRRGPPGTMLVAPDRLAALRITLTY
jgi:hypothetical protein